MQKNKAGLIANPLKATILNFLRRHSAVKLTDLIAVCKPILAEHRFENESHRLYETNFLLMNALFQLQVELLQDAMFLDVDIMNLQIVPSPDAKNAVVRHFSQPDLATYYLDWDNLASITTAEIDDLFSQFKQRLLADDNRSWALGVLGLDEQADKQMAASRYRKLVSEAHPDRGGDPDRFVEVRAAWETLVCTLADQTD